VRSTAEQKKEVVSSWVVAGYAVDEGEAEMEAPLTLSLIGAQI
jgi:hypothetical protein